MPGLVDSTTGLAFGSSLQWMTPIGAAGLTIVTSTIDAPLLELSSAPHTNPPQFGITFDLTVTEGDDVVFQYSQDPGFSPALTITDTLDAAEILAGEITITTGVLAEGTWYFRVRIERGAEVSPWSNVVTDSFGGFVPTFYILGF